MIDFSNITALINNSGHSGVIVQDKNKGDVFYTCPSPTGNCQVYSISYFNNIISLFNSLEDRVDMLSIAQRSSGKMLVTLDVNEKFAPNVEEIYGTENIVFKNPYTSTNNSKMIMYLINTVKIRDYISLKQKSSLQYFNYNIEYISKLYNK